jgi:hypothetical protein
MSNWPIEKIKFLAALAILSSMLLGFAATASAFSWLSDTVIEPVTVEQFYDGTGSNYGEYNGFRARGIMYQGINTVYVSACADSYPVDAVAFVTNGITDEIIATSTRSDIKLCSELNATTTDFTEMSSFQMPNVDIGELQDQTNTFFYSIKPGKAFVTFITATPENAYSNFGGYNNGNGEIISSGSGGPSNRKIGFSLETGAAAVPGQTVNIAGQTYETRFTGGTASGISSSTIQLDINYFLDTSEYSAGNRPDYIQVNVLANGFFSDREVTSAKKIILPLSDGQKNAVIPLDHDFVDGDYLAYLNFWNINTNSITFSKTLLILSFDIVGGEVVNSSVSEVYDNTNFNPATEYADCGISNLGGCFTNALSFTFAPNPGTFDRFTGLYTEIENKPPFGYVTKIKNALAGVGASTTPAFDFGNIPFIATIFEPFKLLMITGLWIIYALFLMGRLDKLDI